MEMTYVRRFSVAADHAFDTLLPAPLPDVFPSWHGPIPPVRATEQDGTWGIPGQRRRVLLAGGSSVGETLLTVDRPRSFTYHLADIVGPLRGLVAAVDGTWTCTPAEDGCMIAWTWDVRPASRLASVGLPLFARLWQGYADKSFDAIARLIAERPS